MTRNSIAIGAAALTLVLGTAFVGGSAAFASGGYGHEGGHGDFGDHGPGMGMMKDLHQLDLSDAQKQQIHELMAAQRGNMKTNGDALRQAHDALRDAMNADNVDEAAIRAASAKLAALEADMAVAHAKMNQQVRAILTEAQRAKLKQLQAERPEPGMGGEPGSAEGTGYKEQ